MEARLSKLGVLMIRLPLNPVIFGLCWSERIKTTCTYRPNYQAYSKIRFFLE